MLDKESFFIFLVLASLNTRLFVAGGWNERSVECYDDERHRWNVSEEMQKGRQLAGMMIIKTLVEQSRTTLIQSLCLLHSYQHFCIHYSAIIEDLKDNQ